MLKIYHNPNCSKSCQALKILENKGLDFETVLYLKAGWTVDTLKSLIKKSGDEVHAILRPADKFYKQENLSEANTEKCICVAIENPTVIERPLIETDTAVFVARPPEKINDYL